MIRVLELIILGLSFFPASQCVSLSQRGTPKTPTKLHPQQSPAQNSTCSSIRVRKEWRTLSYKEKAEYIESVKCLARRPSKLLGPSYRRWDDFEYVHCESRKRIHTRSIFLPWHRYFVLIYESVLRDECQFRGTFPYWNWTLDSKNITQSPLWSSDPVIGFGSNGSFYAKDSDPFNLQSGVVNDGAFARFPIYYPGKMMLQRNFGLDPPLAIPGYVLGSQWFNDNNMAIIFSQSNYSSFLIHLEGNHLLADGTRMPGPHLLIHSIIGGDMPRLAYSVNDPTFFPHHGRVDQCWFTWQKKDWSRRIHEYLPTAGIPATLDDTLDYMGLAPSVKVRDVMNSLIPPLCYEYE